MSIMPRNYFSNDNDIFAFKTRLIFNGGPEPAQDTVVVGSVVGLSHAE